ncbi:hypothetical protein ACLM5H_15875 [Fredinandcohnia humi]
MARTQTMSISEFMSGDYKVRRRNQKKQAIKQVGKVASSAVVPIVTGSAVGTLGLIASAHSAFASSAIPVSAPIAVEASAKEWMGEQTLSALAHVLDPVVDILVALAFPVASVVIVGACFLFMFGNAERAWGMIQNAGLGYVLIQVSPLILNVLKQIGNAV